MIVSLIVASSRNGVIGRANQLPWRLSKDMKNFKRLTTGNAVVMGRKTYESIGRPLPNRQNVIVTRNEDYTAEGCDIAHSLGEALKKCKAHQEVFIIGGAQIYAKALDLKMVNKIYLTTVEADIEGDAYFELDDPEKWLVIEKEKHEADEKNDYPFKIETLERKGFFAKL